MRLCEVSYNPFVVAAEPGCVPVRNSGQRCSGEAFEWGLRVKPDPRYAPPFGSETATEGAAAPARTSKHLK